MASRGLRDYGDGQEKLANAAEAAELRRRGFRVTALTMGSAFVATALVVLASR